MHDLPTVLVLGTVAGLQVSLQALGLVLIYRAGRYINFAQGQIGSLGAAALGVLVLQAGVPYWLAIPVSLGVGVAAGVAVERLLGWRLFQGSRLALMIATIGVAQLILLLTLEPPFRVDPAKITRLGFPEPFSWHARLGSSVLDASEIATLIVAPAIAVALFWFLGRTRLGVAIRGSASNPDAARLAGISVRQVSVVVWSMAAVISTVAAILYAPSQPAVTFSDSGAGLLFESLAAALLAGMTDFRAALGAGLLVGYVTQGAVFWSHTSGLGELLVAAVLVVGLVARSKALAGTVRSVAGLVREISSERPPDRIAGLALVRRSAPVGWGLLFLVLAALPAVPGLQTQERAVFLLFIVSYAMAGLGLTVLTGWAGQVSLGQFAFLGVGAYAASFADRHNLGVPMIFIVAGAVTAAASTLVGLAAIRVKGIFLAAITVAFAFVARDWLFHQSWVTGNPSGIDHIEHLRILGLHITTVRGAYYLGLVVLAVTVAGLGSLRRTSVGRALIAVRDNADLASSHGMPPTAVKASALALSGLVTGAGGALWAMAQGSWSFTSFDPTMSFVLLSCAVVGGLGSLAGPILGALLVFAWPYLVPNADTLAIRSFTSGILLLAVLLFVPGGLVSLASRIRSRMYRWTDANYEAFHFAPVAGAPPLEAAGVSVSFGGVRALDGVSIRVAAGEIVGLIGGNGAGKSTLLDCISGHLRPDDGEIRLAGRDVAGLAAEYRPALGVRRTFQDAGLFPGLTVTEALLAAVDRDNRSGALGSLVSSPWTRAGEAAKRRHVEGAIDSFGLRPYAGTLTGELSTGTRRVCELAATVAGHPSLVLLDEPTAGLAQREVEASEPLLRSLRDVHGCAVLIVEHDIGLMLNLCDRIYCLEEGRVIAHGPPAEIASDEAVIASYLGMDRVALERSGSAAPAVGARAARTPAARTRAKAAAAAVHTNGKTASPSTRPVRARKEAKE